MSAQARYPSLAVGVVEAFLAPKVIGPILALAAWVVGLCAAAHMMGLWDTDVRNDTVVWFVTVGVVFFFSLERVSAGGFFRSTARRAIAVTVFVEAFVNLAVLPLLVEFFLLPVAGFLAVMAAFSEGKEEYAPVRRLVNSLLGAIGSGLLLFFSPAWSPCRTARWTSSTVSVDQHYEGIDPASTTRRATLQLAGYAQPSA
jgi:hypothetical protein